MNTNSTFLANFYLVIYSMIKGNICSIMSVTALGQGIGYSVVQSALLVSGLWGIYWYREIKDPVAVRKWFISAFITLCGMLWLSYEHKA